MRTSNKLQIRIVTIRTGFLGCVRASYWQLSYGFRVLYKSSDHAFLMWLAFAIAEEQQLLDLAANSTSSAYEFRSPAQLGSDGAITRESHLARGYCCNNGCLHCPYQLANAKYTREEIIGNCRHYGVDVAPGKYLDFLYKLMNEEIQFPQVQWQGKPDPNDALVASIYSITSKYRY